MPASSGQPSTVWRTILESPKARLKDRLQALEKLVSPSRALLYRVAIAPTTPSKLRAALALRLEALLEARAKQAVAKLKEKSSGH